jgi:hypothetical protein
MTSGRSVNRRRTTAGRTTDVTTDQESLPLGVVVERRRVESRWKDHDWRPIAVFAGAPPRDPKGEWIELRRDEGWVQFHAGTLPLELFRRETEGYRLNLSQEPPRLFVVMRSGEDADSPHEAVPFLVTACPYEAQDYLDSGEELVEAVAMPPDVVAFVQSYVDAHHVDEPFHKRKRRPHTEAGDSFARRPRVDRPRGDKGSGR